MFTPLKREPIGAINEMAFQTPQAQLSFSKELRQVLQERNLLTAKSRKKVCSMLDRSYCSPSTSLTGAPLNPEVDKRRGFRLQAIQEIISSEKAYLRHLELLMEFFVRPLKERDIIDDASHMSLFGQIEMIYNLNGEFLRELENDMDNVAAAFLKMAPFFKLYSVYAFDYKSALLILQDVTSKNPVFRKFLEQTESRPEVQRKLNSLMIVPIQRVPRYKLLLEQVLLYTSPADRDFKLLKESIKQIESTASHINSCIDDQEVTQLLLNLQNSLANRTPNIVKPSRKVIKEGCLQKVTRNGAEIKRYCVLMSDIFMYCKILKERPANTVVDNSLECCCIFPLKKCKVYEMFPGTFKLTCQGDGIILRTKDLQLGRIWVGFIRDAIDLHIQCRQTLRKESSKRKPMRKKEVIKFGADYVLSPSKKKCDYETIFRQKRNGSDSECELDTTTNAMSCFSRKKSTPVQTPVGDAGTNVQQPKAGKPLKRPAPPAPSIPAPALHCGDVVPPQNCLSKLCKFIAPDKQDSHRTLKRNDAAVVHAVAHTIVSADATYGFTASRFSDTKSYFRTHNIDNTIPTAVRREDLFGNVSTATATEIANFRDVLFPLRSSGGSNKIGANGGWTLPSMEKENENLAAVQPQKKRVKFEAQDSAGAHTAQAFYFPTELTTLSAADGNNQVPRSLREKIYEFFAKLF